MLYVSVPAGSWLGTNGAISFGLSVAVGLIPEMLPMVVTANLCCGALAMSKKKNIVRHMDSIPNLGAMWVVSGHNVEAYKHQLLTDLLQ